MCGIAGLFGAPGGVDLDAGVRRMAAELVHRGPDDEGVWLDPAHAPAVTAAQAVSTDRPAIHHHAPVALSLTPTAEPTDAATVPEHARGAV